MPEDGAHDVHLRMTGSTVAAFCVDRFEDGSRRGQRQAGSAILLGDQRGEVAGLGQRLHELGGIRALTIQLAPVFAGEAGAELGDLDADLSVRVGWKRMVHGATPAAAFRVRRMGEGVQEGGVNLSRGQYTASSSPSRS